MPTEIDGSRVLLTGAGSGIGRSLALRLGLQGAVVALVGRNEGRLVDTAMAIRASGGSAYPFVFDLSRPSGQEELAQGVLKQLGGIDVLVNNAGISRFCEFSRQEPDEIESLFRTNVVGPMLLTRAVLPHFIRKNSGSIVNIGSTAGSIGFGHFSAYSSTKFALRGFSEALRRELDHTEIEVVYVAPRATKTSLNSDAAVELSRQTRVVMDEADDVAAAILKSIRGGRDRHIGWPENILMRFNSLFPSLVDIAFRKRNRLARDLASLPVRAWKSGNVRYHVDFRKKEIK